MRYCTGSGLCLRRGRQTHLMSGNNNNNHCNDCASHQHRREPPFEMLLRASTGNINIGSHFAPPNGGNPDKNPNSNINIGGSNIINNGTPSVQPLSFSSSPCASSQTTQFNALQQPQPSENQSQCSVVPNQQVQISAADLLNLLMMAVHNKNKNDDNGNSYSINSGIDNGATMHSDRDTTAVATSEAKSPTSTYTVPAPAPRKKANTNTKKTNRPRVKTPLNNSRLPVGSIVGGKQIFSCRARGMPESHNFKTAILTVPPDTKHGQGLVCSHPTCRNGGIKFAYCLYCKRPVSKRLFRGKHKYCGPVENDSSEEGELTKEIEPSPSTNKKPRHESGENNKIIQPTSRNKKSSLNYKLSGSEEDQVPLSNQNKMFEAPAVSDNYSLSNFQGGSMTTETATSDSSLASSPSKVPIKKQGESTNDDNMDSLTFAYITQTDRLRNDPQRAWDVLLTMRPATSDAERMSSWLRAVVHVSNYARGIPASTKRRPLKKRRMMN